MLSFIHTHTVLIDRDNSPKWNPSTLSDLSDQQVEAYFEAPSKEFKELQL